MINKKNKVVLSGDGGDELFGLNCILLENYGNLFPQSFKNVEHNIYPIHQ